MKREDIDKRIGMPDVDAEWEKFEREVIGQKKASRKSLYWGMGIAASIALLAGYFLFGNDAKETRQTIAQKTIPTKQMPSVEETIIDEEHANPPEKNLPSIVETKQHPSSNLLAEATLHTPDNEEKLQGRIAGLDIVSTSADLGTGHIMRLGGNSTDGSNDSVLIVVNGQQPTMTTWDELQGNNDIYHYFFNRHQLIDDILILKDEAARAIYGEQGKNCRGILEISTTQFTPVAQLSPEERMARRQAYLLNSYHQGFKEDVNKKRFAPDLFDTSVEEHFFYMLVQRHGRLRREYFGPVGSDAHGVYVPLIREAVIAVHDNAWYRDGKIITSKNLELDSILSEIDRVAKLADNSISRTDSVARKAFIFGGTITETTPRPLYTDIWGYASRYLWDTTFRFVPNADAPSFWWAEIYQPTSGQRRVDMHLHSVDKLYASDCPEILANSRKVEGIVLNEHDKPMTDAIVSVGNSPATETVQVRTDSTGQFELILPFRNATMEVDCPGYRTVSRIQPSDSVLTIRLKHSNLTIKEVKVSPKEFKKYEKANIQGTEP